MIHIDLQQAVPAAPDQVLATLLDHQNLHRFFNAGFTLSKPQNDGEVDGGKGSIRQITIGRFQFFEEIIKAEEDHICYRIVGKAPVSDHEGNIYLDPDGRKTRLRYLIHCRGPKWLPDFLLQFFIARDIKNALAKLARHFA